MTSIPLPLNAYSTNAYAMDPFNISDYQQSSSSLDQQQQYINPNVFKNLLASKLLEITNGSNDNEEENNNSFWSGMQSTYQTTSSQPANLFSPAASVYQEMIAKANLIGKVVDAIDPATNQKFSGTVKGVTIDSGSLKIEVGDKIVPPENLISIRR
ncbi:hypothetical protein A3J90_07295 [candidate division WOR-1 bacterium RIFOXYC2_FULL_37_10]|uniref:Flagellar hook capping protein n=1 Tax=candidate division WOR-1 bacterium RIFOXYB2_FULL_37_13 TaxID=1802579 RepID=A0A1F4SEU7_UNCSA|nr:MAG: hypothetical protein A2246_00995 [candidate division WOR-1 bacterium RIFOXYA2_FULL_37_7]OGC18962.1 MAG: hypothetical protein A2310_05995 [candidate division WOR-1 bacterium RIFOXYB2_FULL_37_13]OGC32414.1 MAG: hypothetical protein A3J90_07295 [candidate division WOR-1 bacterium RIFOXYC2_FULL_37_10]